MFTIIFFVITTTGITTLILLFFYNAKSQGGLFYYMSNDIMQDLQLTSILGVVLPALVTAQIVTIVVAVVIGLFSSRKAAVPVYKLERWALQLKKGKLKTHLGFREIKEMRDLTIQCNALADTYKQIFSDIEDSLKIIAEDRVYKSQAVAQEISNIKATLSKLDYK
jgi:signal transduction histidine kinase